jgi:hypothetical protein
VIKLYLYIYKYPTKHARDQCLVQQQEDQINTQDNLPSIEEATEREPCGLRII